MNKKLIHTELSGIVHSPPSKSDAQRAILIAALAKGTSIIHSPGKSNDVMAIIENATLLGATIKLSADKLTIKGTKEIPRKATFNASESGLGFRMLTALCANVDGIHTINAAGTLLQRHQGAMIDHLNEFGCKVDSNNGFPPITIQGKIDETEICIDANETSQFLSGLLIACAIYYGDSKIEATSIKSSPYIQMTMATMKQFGVTVQHIGNTFSFPELNEYLPCKYTVEGDWSGASNWFVAAALGAEISIGGLNSETFQADQAIIEALLLAGCEVHYKNEFYTVDAQELQPFEFDASNCPDLFPALVVLAAACEGKSVIQGAKRLINKESNRANVLIQEFDKLGLIIAVEENIMSVHGTGKLCGGTIDPHSDHRIAMCVAISSLIATDEIVIQNAECVEKSYPDFWKDFKLLSRT